MKEEFDPSGVGLMNGKLFGFPYELEDCKTIVIPVPWDVTVSYEAGTAQGPIAILDASPQLDFYDANLDQAWTYGIGMVEEDPWIKTENEHIRTQAIQHIDNLEQGGDVNFTSDIVRVVNDSTTQMIERVKERCEYWLEKGRKVVILGGDHSTPLGLMQALSDRNEEFGILQIDAHADLRDAYEGFQHSHASIMFNAKELDAVKKIVQVGIRDVSPAEMQLAEEHTKLELFHDQHIQEALMEGTSWKQLCEKFIASLPQKVYVSFDIDGLDPKLCPSTGTPVPGGMEFDQAMYLVKSVVESGREIIGFDLVEVAPGEETEWDANVGARILYKLNNLMNASVAQ